MNIGAYLMLAVGLAAAPVAAGAEDSGDNAVSAGQYVHQSWTARDGAPPAVCAIAQGPDGYLWLGTGLGLYRFDGIEFTRYQAPPGQHLVARNITALTFSRDGGLWIGAFESGATYLKDGNVRSWGTQDGFPAGWVNDFTESPEGDIWVAAGRGLGRFHEGRWQTIGKDWGYDAAGADWVAFDHAGNLWVATGTQLVYLPSGARRFQDTAIELSPAASIAIGHHGEVWVTDRLHGTRIVDAPSAPARVPEPAFAASRMAFDRHGGLWATAVNNASVFHVGAERLPLPRGVVGDTSISDRFAAPLELSSNTAIPVAVDREDTVWVGTGVGIDSYHRSPIGTLRDHRLDRTHLGMAIDSAGQVWVSSLSSVFALRDQKLVPVAVDLPDTIGSILMGRDDTLWLIGYRDLFRMRGGHPERVELPDRLFASRLKFIASGPPGVLWASIEGLGMYRLDAHGWTSWSPRTQGLGGIPTTGLVEADGSMWLGYADGALLRVEAAGPETVYRFPAGSEIGTVTAISEGPLGVLFGGTAGLASVAGGRLMSTTDKSVPALSGITGMAQDDAGAVWINAGRGIVRYSKDDLENMFAKPGFRPDAQGFDFRDGIHGSARQGKPVGTMLRDGNGRLWFLTNEDIYWFKPPWRRENLLPPPVHIKAIVADGARIEAGEHMTLRPGESSLQIDYTALSLSSPSRLRFRYQLEGVDPGWVDVRGRRQAYYTNLSPGTYQFRVIASNDEGIWNERAAQVALTIPPRFFQTWWFHAGVAIVTALIAALLYARHVRRIARNAQLQSDARHQERERIARELHDTLLQAIYGIVLKFQAIMAAMPDADPLKESMRGTLRVASDFIVEGRNRVRDLRTRLATTAALSEAIVELVVSLRQAEPITIESRITVVDEPMDPTIAEDMLGVCREALINTLRHAQATRIDVELQSTPQGLLLRITDNGIGMPGEGSPPQERHDPSWGIVGMQERAKRMGGQLEIRSRPGATVVALDAPLRLPHPHVRLWRGPRGLT